MAQDSHSRTPTLALFRQRCRQFQWLSWLMVGSIVLLFGTLFVLGFFVGERFWSELPSYVVHAVPNVCYVAAVWIMGQAMGALARGDLFQPVLARALRHAGVALAIGGVFSVFLQGNLLRIMGFIQGGFLNFDVPGMTLGMFGGALFLMGTLVDQAGRVQAELNEMI